MVRWHNDLDELARCELCEHRCGVDRLAGERGVCRVLEPEVASRSLHPAPPASYTVFLAGCNFKCLHCQNWTISQYPDNGCDVDGFVAPKRLAVDTERALASSAGAIMGADRLFFSGGEPTIHLPYVEQVVAAAREFTPSCKVNFDTNGFMTERSLARVLALATSLTFDLKAWSDATHRALTGVPVAPVLRNAAIVAREAPEKLWEYRIVVVPGVNEEDIAPLCRFLAELSVDLPVCFLAFRPNFVLAKRRGASRSLMLRCAEQADAAGLRNVSWAGHSGIPATGGEHVNEDNAQQSGADLAENAARQHGCLTTPRDCGQCDQRGDCRLKRHVPCRCT